MRARLLDLGNVSALRAESLPHALTAAAPPDGDPGLVLLRPASRYVSVGLARDLESEVDLAFCAAHDLPVLRRHGTGAAAVRDENRLLFHWVLPAARAVEAGLPPDLDARREYLARPQVEALRALGLEASFFPPDEVVVGNRTIAGVEAVEIGGGLCLSGEMVLALDPALAAKALAPRAAGDGEPTSIAGELAETPPLAEVAERLVAAFEACHGLELIPSMPTPAEMDAVVEWDRRLTSEAAPEAAAAVEAGRHAAH